MLEKPLNNRLMLRACINIKPVHEAKYLGVRLLEDLSSDRQARVFTGRCYDAIHAVAQFKSLLLQQVEILVMR